MRRAIPLALLSLSLGCPSRSGEEGKPAAKEPPLLPPSPPQRSSPPPVPSPRPRQVRPEEKTLRAGARRLEAFRPERYEVRFEGERTMRLKAVERALGKDRLGGVVGPFTQRSAAAGRDGARDVANAGDIVALALARQLELLGWSTLVAASAPRAESDTDGRPSKEEEARVRAPLTRLGFAGEVAFWVVEGDPGARATLEGTVSVRDEGGSELLKSQVVGHGKGPDTEPSLVRRVRGAEEAALAAFVRRLLTDTRMSAALVRAITAARRGR